MRKILFVLLLAITVVSGLSMVSAADSDAIDLGDIESADIDVTDFDKDTYDLDFKSTVKVDISDLSGDDKKLLEDTLNDTNSSYILNLTCGDYITIALWTYDGLYNTTIDGDTLTIECDNQYTLDEDYDPEDLEIYGISFNTTDGQLLDAEIDD
jgi:hypothetical protein